MSEKDMSKKSLYKHSITSNMLLSIAKASGEVLEALPYFLAYKGGGLSAYCRSGEVNMSKQKDVRVRQQKALHELKKNKLVVVKRDGDRYRAALTKDGILQVFRLKVLKARVLEDDSVCMVIFDIPETERDLRQLLREFLSEAGFILIQRSVWISPFDAGQALVSLFRATGAVKWVRVFSSRQIV
jgi:hypothetical protein